MINAVFSYCATFEVDISSAEITDGNFIVLMNGSWNSWGWGYQLDESDDANIYSGTFCGFENLSIKNAFRRSYNDSDLYDLMQWDLFEKSNPRIFAGMYQFWCQKS